MKKKPIKIEKKFILMDKGKQQYVYGGALTVDDPKSAKRFDTEDEATNYAHEYKHEAQPFQRYVIQVNIFEVTIANGRVKKRSLTYRGSVQ